jgi:pimeloyl-ACP methyl ester carboxylesterase
VKSCCDRTHDENFRKSGKIMIWVIAILLLLLAGLFIYAYTAGPTLPPETEAIIESVLNSELPAVVRGKTGFASSDGLNIWYESISTESSPKGTVLLIMGNGADALIWPPKFVQAFPDAGYQVIRYDHRGTGMSDWVKDWDSKNPYSVADMTGDAVAVLDTLGIQEVHIVGFSMGGMIAQQIAIHHPDRVASLTLMMTSGYIGDPELPGLTSTYFFNYILQGIPLLKYRIAGGEENLIKERIAKTIMVVGVEKLDIQEIAEVVLYDLRNRRGINIRAAFQHQAAVSISGSRVEELKTLNVPTLVIHGTADRFIPVEHGKKLVKVIPNAKGLWLDGTGHVLPVPNMDALTKDILSHFDDK